MREPVDLTQIKALSFDLDNTLWPVEPIIERAEQATHDWLKDRYPNTYTILDTPKRQQIRTEVLNDYADRHFDVVFLRKEYIARILQQSGYDREGVEPAFEVFQYERNTIALFDDVKPFFEQLDARYHKIVLTNGSASLERTPLVNTFDAFFNAKLVQAAKPDAAIFERALAEYSLQPHQMLHVGDCLEADVKGANDLGIPTVWVNRRGAPWNQPDARPDFVINSFDQMNVLLADAPP